MRTDAHTHTNTQSLNTAHKHKDTVTHTYINITQRQHAHPDIAFCTEESYVRDPPVGAAVGADTVKRGGGGGDKSRSRFPPPDLASDIVASLFEGVAIAPSGRGGVAGTRMGVSVPSTAEGGAEVGEASS